MTARLSTCTLTLIGMLTVCSHTLAQTENAYDPPRPSANWEKSGIQCVEPAAEYHQVNSKILEAILRVESGLKPNTITRNTNNTIDVGLAGINSVHFPELGRYGIAPQDLLKPCVNIYVAAWHLAKQYRKFGNTWWAVGAYHSTTTIHNTRYQGLVAKQLNKMGVSQEAQPKNVAPVERQVRQSLVASNTHE